MDIRPQVDSNLNDSDAIDLDSAALNSAERKLKNLKISALNLDDQNSYDLNSENLNKQSLKQSSLSKNPALKLSIIISLAMHLVLLVLLASNQFFLNQQVDETEATKLITYLDIKLSSESQITEQEPTPELKPEPEPEPEPEKKLQQATPTDTIPAVQEVVENTELSPPEEDKKKPGDAETTSKPITNSITKPITKPINYATLSASITNVITQDQKNFQDASFDECERIKAKTGALDCVSNVERLGFKHSDPYNLSKIFKALDKHPNGKKRQRLIARLLSKESNYQKILENKDLSPDLQQLFKDEIAFLRGEVHYQDCGGSPNSGSCAGEIDLVKVASLIGLLFKD